MDEGDELGMDAAGEEEGSGGDEVLEVGGEGSPDGMRG